MEFQKWHFKCSYVPGSYIYVKYTRKKHISRWLNLKKWQFLPVTCKKKKKKLKIWHKLIDSCQYFTAWLHVLSSINFWITNFTNVFLLFKSKNLFDLKSISRNYCHKIDISFFFFMQWCYYFTRFIQLFICINPHLSPRCL